LISALVVVVGGLATFVGAQVLTKHTQVLAVAKNVPVGARITGDDLAVANLSPDGALSPIPASQRGQVIGQYAQVGLVEGSTLTRGEIGPDNGFASGQMLVALPLKPGQFPAQGLSPGQKVLIVETPGQAGASQAGAGQGGGSSASSAKSAQGTVADVGPVNASTQVTVVDVRVSADEGVRVAQMASTTNFAVILLPSSR
jgi:hypothetical protein